MQKALTEAQVLAVLKVAQAEGDLGMSQVNSLNATSQAESEVYFCASRVCRAVARGCPLDEVLAEQDSVWRAHAADVVKRGKESRTGRWVSANKFTSYSQHLRFLIERAIWS